MKIKRGFLAGLVGLLAFAHHLPAQSTDPSSSGDLIPPQPINLDIPPQTILDPEQIQLEEEAVQAILRPQEFHTWLLQIEPGREMKEQLAALAFLRPDAFRRAHPVPPEQSRAEVVAAHAILNPPFPLPFTP